GGITEGRVPQIKGAACQCAEIPVPGAVDEDGRAPCLAPSLRVRDDGGDLPPVLESGGDPRVILESDARLDAEFLQQELQCLRIIAERTGTAAGVGSARLQLCPQFLGKAR